MSEYRIEKPEAVDIQKAYQPVVSVAQGLSVVDQMSHGLALAQMKQLRSAEKKVRERLDPLIASANAAHKGLTKLRADLLRPIERAVSVLDGRCQEYERNEREKAFAEAARLQEEARKGEEERQIMDAIAAEEQGDKATAAAIMDEKPIVPVIVVAPALAKVEGVFTRANWRAEVHDKLALIRYVATHPEWVNLVDANESALNGIAKSQRSALAIPGVRAVEEQIRSVRA